MNNGSSASSTETKADVTSSPATAPVRVVWDRELLRYDFGPVHPMAPTRLDLTMRLVEELGLLDRPGIELVQAPIVDDEVLATVHEPEYIAAVRAASHGVIDPARGLGTEDDPVFDGMHEAAARIVGGSYEAAGALWSGAASHAVNIAGGMHHAKPGAASGFCIYNDSAVAIKRLLAEGAERVAYVDLDAHHGDGVEAVFWDDPRVLTVSVHQNGATLFPGTGSPMDVGEGAAAGTAVNLALPPRTDSARWLRAIDAIVPAVISAFRPDVLVTQHGCDSHSEDPLSDLRVCVGAQRKAAAWMHDLAHKYCAGRWLAVGGGGYAVARVVPLSWTCLVADVIHTPIEGAMQVPQSWREYVEETAPVYAPEDFGDEVVHRPWSAGYDPGDDVDRTVLATRRSVFPLLGLDPHYD